MKDGASGRMQPAIESKTAPVRGLARVVSNEADGHGQRIVLAIPDWPGSIPGQFMMVGAGAESAAPRQDPLLPRPMAVYREVRPASAGSADDAHVEVLYRVVGRGTKLLAQASPGESIRIVGPLGRGFPTGPTGSAGSVESPSPAAILVGGGTGIASLFELAKALVAQGQAVVVLLGGQSAADLMGRRDFEALDVELICTTEDGSDGVHGRVTVPLEARLTRDSAGDGGCGTVYAVGPTPMMKACADLAQQHSATCYVSLENPMACGFGVCLGCAAPRAEGGFSLVCRAGPVFRANEIDWEGLP